MTTGVKKIQATTRDGVGIMSSLEEKSRSLDAKFLTPLGAPTAEKTDDHNAQWGEFVLVNETSKTVTLPSALVGRVGQFIAIKNLHSTSQTVRPSGSDTIDGSTGTVTVKALCVQCYLCVAAGEWIELWRSSEDVWIPTAVKTAAYTVSQFNELARLDPSSGGFVVTLQAITSSDIGKKVCLKSVASDPGGAISVVPATGQDILEEFASQWADYFDDGAVGSAWTQDANNGTISESGSRLNLDVALSTNGSWDATYKNAPLAILPFSKIDPAGGGLICLEVEHDQLQIGNTRMNGIGLFVDDQNALWLRFNQSSGGLEGMYRWAQLVANVLTEAGAWSTGVANAWPMRVRVYYNRHASAAYVIEDAESLAAGDASWWVSYDGAAWTKAYTLTPGITPTAFVLSGQNTTGGGSAQVQSRFESAVVRHSELALGRPFESIVLTPVTATQWAILSHYAPPELA